MKAFKDIKLGMNGVDYNGNNGIIVTKGSVEELIPCDISGQLKEGVDEGYINLKDNAVGALIDGELVYFDYGYDGFYVE